MFQRELLSQKIPFNLTEEKWKEIENLEDFNYTLKSRYKDLTGCQYDRLIILGKGPNEESNGKKFCRWWCICSCPEHNIILTRTGNLNSGNTKSCGCLNQEKSRQRIIEVGKSCAKDLTGQVFGELTALYPTEKRNNNGVVWICQCSCGRIHKVKASELIRGGIYSCGHHNISKGEEKICKILDKVSIFYTKEKTFPDLKSDRNGCLRYDFYLPEYNRLIEYDGEQHFKDGDKNFWKDNLIIRQQHDQIKNEYALSHNIPLVRIPYTELKNINLEMLLGNDFLIKENK